MRSSDAKALVRALVDAWNDKDITEVCSLLDEDFENWQMPLPVVRGLDAYRRHLERWFSAYPDLRLEIVTLLAEGDEVCLETAATGQPQDAFFGVRPRRGARVNRALDILVVRDAKVSLQRGYWDFSLWTGHPSPLASRRSD